MFALKDVEALGDLIGDLIAEATEPLKKRIAELEQREYSVPESEVEGVVRRMLPEPAPVVLPKDGRDGRDGIDGKDATDEQIAAAVERYMAAHPIPVPKDGKDGQDGRDGIDGAPGRDGIDGKDGADGIAGKDGAPGKDGRDGVDGKSVSLEDVKPFIEGELAKYALDFERRGYEMIERAISRIQQPKDGVDGKDADPDEVARRVIDKLDLRGSAKQDIAKLCKELVAAAVKEIPVPQDGRDGVDGKDGESVTEDQVAEIVRKHLAANPPPAGKDGQDGKDAEVSVEIVKSAVSEYLSANPPAPGRDGADGRSVTVDQVLDEIRESVSAEVKSLVDAMPRPKDGESVTVGDVEPVLRSMQAEWTLDFEKRAQATLAALIERAPKPRDAFELETFDTRLDGRTLTTSFKANGKTYEHSVVLDYPMYHFIWNKDAQYAKSDMVTFDGSMWIATEANKNSKPGQYNKHWKLCVKRGRDGRDGQ